MTCPCPNCPSPSDCEGGDAVLLTDRERSLIRSALGRWTNEGVAGLLDKLRTSQSPAPTHKGDFMGRWRP